MQFQIKKRKSENIHRYPTEDVRITKLFAEKLKTEFGDFLKAVVVFGSTIKHTSTAKSDIDVLVIVDDLAFVLTDDLIEAYKLIVERAIADISFKLHVTSMTFTSFWEYVRAGDPVAINILRDGASLYDTGFFEPLQELLRRGRIRATDEAVWSYFGRAPRTLVNAKWHMLQATLDLYWAVIDATHAALMRIHEIPPSPEHAAEMLEKKLVKPGYIEHKYALTMRKFYDISKKIVHREIQSIDGRDFDRLTREANEFVERMHKFI
ncbi:MAG: nucleotidyltransferase domain-containing protein, partial [Candidatus Woesearchaeota archaeon]